MAAKTLRERNGSLLLRPQSPVARVLELTSACNLLTVRGEADVAPGPGRQAGPRVLGECVRACWKYFSVLPTVTASAAPASMTGFAG